MIHLDPNVPLVGVGPTARHYPSGSVPARLAYKYQQNAVPPSPPVAIVEPNANPKSAPMSVPATFRLETVVIADPQGLNCVSRPGCGQIGTGDVFCGTCV